MPETSGEQQKPKIMARRTLHLRAADGSTYGDELLDEAQRVIGYRSSWIGTGKNKGKQNVVYTLRSATSESREFGSFEFLAAYTKKLEQDRRDKEWSAAAPKGEIT
jgi:hypothetical protein